MGWKDAFEVVTRIDLDNPLASAKVAQGPKKRNSIVEIVPNTFGGVNTHLWRNDAYIIGIVPVVRPAYSSYKRNEIRREGALLVLFILKKTWRAAHQKVPDYHETEDGNIFHTEEARCGTDRMGVANDR